MVDTGNEGNHDAGTSVVDVSTPVSQRSYGLQIADPHLATAADTALHSARWTRSYENQPDEFIITDDLNRRGPLVILVVDDAPGSCQLALRALLEEKIAGVASRSELDRLPIVLTAAMGQMAAVPTRVLKASARLPQLEDRQRRVLELLATGLSNTVIAARLHVSQATVKREVSELLQIFKASNRLELAMRGAEAGLIETARLGAVRSKPAPPPIPPKPWR